MKTSKLNDAIAYNGLEYVFDMGKICQFVIYSDKTSSKEHEVLDNYEINDGNKIELVSKSVRELSGRGNEQIDNIKYDFIKMFIDLILTYNEYPRQLDELPFGVKIAFETLINEEFLIPINDK